MRRILGTLAGTAIIVAGCSSSNEDPTPRPPALDRDNSAAAKAWTLDLPVVSKPQVVDDTVVVVVTSGKDKLDVVGIDAATGKKSWSKPFSPGVTPVGYGVEPLVTDSKDVAYIRTLSSQYPGYSRVETVDPATGNVTMTSKDDIYPITPLTTCDAGGDICVQGFAQGDTKTSRSFRIDVETGVMTRSDDETPEGARSLAGDGLFATSDRPGEKLGVRRDGKTLWESPVTDLIGKGYISDAGWSFQHDDETDVYTGYLGQDFLPAAKDAQEKKEPFTRDIGQERALSFSGATGKVIWNKLGAITSCVKREDGPLPKGAGPVRCIQSGSLIYPVDPKDGETAEYADVAVTVEGYAAATGKTTWSVQLSPAGAEALVKGGSKVLSPDATFMVVSTKEGQELISTKDGESSALKAAARFACSGTTEPFDYAIPGRDARTYYATPRVSSCDASGKTVDGDMTVSAVKDGGVATSGSDYVVLAEDGLVGYTTAASK